MSCFFSLNYKDGPTRFSSGSHGRLRAENVNLVQASGLRETRGSLNASSVSSSLHNTSVHRLNLCHMLETPRRIHLFCLTEKNFSGSQTDSQDWCQTFTDVLFSSSCLKSLYRLNYFRGTRCNSHSLSSDCFQGVSHGVRGRRRNHICFFSLRLFLPASTSAETLSLIYFYYMILSRCRSARRAKCVYVLLLLTFDELAATLTSFRSSLFVSCVKCSSAQ